MFDDWCDIDEADFGERKTLFSLTEKDGGRAAINGQLVTCVRSHYDALERIAEDVARLGFPGAGAILSERLPRTLRARSGELGEILAMEFIEAQSGFRIPVRRLRYKDGREMALRGDDFLGVSKDDENHLLLLKGESKSRQRVVRPVIADARSRLSADDGRPTPISLLFVADRLLEADGEDADLGRTLRDEIALKAVPARRITHALFTLSGNDPTDELSRDMDAADGTHAHISANLEVQDHRAFIAEIYEEAGNLGDD